VTSIVVSKRDGIVKAPDGTKYRVARGKTLADARHPVVEAYPHDWVPMVVALSVEDGAPGSATANSDDLHDRLGQAENDLAEVEELAEHRGAELVRLAEGLAGFGYDLPAEADRRPGWLVDLVLDALPVRAATASLPLDAPAPHSATEAAVEYPTAPIAEPPVIAPPRAPRKGRTPRA
jgi:hypothetical protein